MKPEEWRTIPSFPVYEASSWGGIRSQYRVLRQYLDTSGYKAVNVAQGGRFLKRRVHWLVCEAFHGPKPAWAALAAHRNGKKLVNRPGNLRWSTYQGNSDDMIAHGTRLNGEKHLNALFTASQVKTIRAQYAKEPTRATVGRLADAFMVDRRVIRDIVSERTWREPKPKCKRRLAA